MRAPGLLAGALFGLAARSFATLTHQLRRLFSKISYPPLRPVVGTMRYAGLGGPVIAAAFQHPLGS